MIFSLFGLLPRSVLLPPVSLLMAAIGFWAVAQWRPRLGLRLLGPVLLGLLAMALPVTSGLLFAGLERGIVLRRPAGGDAAPAAIVILGGDGSLGLAVGAIFGGPQPGSLSLERLRAGAALQRRVDLPILLTGGAPRPGAMPVSVLMRLSLEDDFRAQATWIETRSFDTWENAEFSSAILAQAGIRSVYVVTHAWHLRRAMIAFAHFGIAVWPAPVSLQAMGGGGLEMFVPSATAWLESYFALHEWVGCAFYALRR